MKTKLVAVLLMVSVQVISQSEEIPTFKRNSFGLEYEFYVGNPNIGLTYRRFYNDWKYNLKASLFVGGRNNFMFFHQQSDLFYKTNDSTMPFLGVSNTNITASSFKRIEFGGERITNFKYFDILAGVGLNLEHIYSSRYSEVYQPEEIEVNQNGKVYSQIVNHSLGSLQGINSLTSSFNYLSTGISIYGGTRFDISKNLYFTALLTIRTNVTFVISEKNEYRNDLYKDHLPEQRGASTFDFDTGYPLEYITCSNNC